MQTGQDKLKANESEKCYSLDGERYMDYDDMMEWALDNYQPGKVIEVYQGEVVRLDHDHFLDIQDLITLMAESSDECMLDEDGVYLLDLFNDKKKQEELKSLIVNWLDKNVKPFPCYSVENIKEIKITV